MIKATLLKVYILHLIDNQSNNIIIHKQGREIVKQCKEKKEN